MIIFKKRRKTIIFVLLAIILPTSLSLGCLFAMIHIKSQSSRGLVFEKYNVDLGELNYDMEVKVSFPFKNATSDIIKIRKINADCRCTDVSANKKEILPGEAGIIDVNFTTSNRRGPETHSIAVVTDSLKQEVVKLTISAVIDPQMELIPRALSFGRVSSIENSMPREVSIVSRFREQGKTIGVSSSNPYIKAMLLSKEPAHSREAGRIRVELCGKPPSGKLEGDIAVITRTEKGIVNSSIKVVAEILGTVQASSHLNLR